jgi:hypothetical protein
LAAWRWKFLSTLQFILPLVVSLCHPTPSLLLFIALLFSSSLQQALVVIVVVVVVVPSHCSLSNLPRILHKQPTAMAE